MNFSRWPLARLLPVVLLFSAIFMTGCKPKDEDAVRVATFTSDVETIKILNAGMRQIESKHPGLKIILANIPYNDYQNKITTMMAAGNAPDVVSTEVNNFVDLYLRDAFEDLTPLVQRDNLDLKAYYPAVMKRYSPGGKVYALPTDIAPFGLMYYNKKIFDEAGIPYPTEKWTWADFLTICQKLVKKDATGKIIRWGYGDPYGTGADLFLISNGGYYMDNEDNPTRLALDSPRALEAFKFRQDLIYTYQVSPTPAQIQAFNFGPGAETLFANGQIAMMASGIWHTPNFLQHKDLSFDVTKFPWGPHHTRGWGSGGSGYAMTKGSKKKDQAWIVIKELAGEDIESQMALTGLVQPSLIKVANSDAFLKSPGPANKKILLDMPKEAHFGPFVKDWNEIWYGQVGPAMDPVWLGTKKPEDVLTKLIPELNKKYFGVK